MDVCRVVMCVFLLFFNTLNVTVVFSALKIGLHPGDLDHPVRRL
jgi:hypothetical protein